MYTFIVRRATLLQALNTGRKNFSTFFFFFFFLWGGGGGGGRGTRLEFLVSYGTMTVSLFKVSDYKN